MVPRGGTLTRSATVNMGWIDVLQTGASIAGLLLLNAVFAACETGLVRLRYSSGTQHEHDRIRAQRSIAALLEQAHRTALCIRFGMTLVTIALGLVLFPFLHGVLGGLAFFADGPGRILVILLAFGVAAGAHAVIGEMIPRAVAHHSPKKIVMRTAGFVRVTNWVLWPIIWLLQKSANFILARFNLTPVRESVNLLDAEVQIRALGEEDLTLSPELRRILSNTLRLRDLEVSDVVLPRNQVQYLDLHDGVEENLALARKAGHTRFPLCDGDLDRCVGIIHVKDIFRYGGEDRKMDLNQLKREIIAIPQNEPLEEGMKRLLRQKMHMALVTDEFGGTVGVLTLERILEEMVGEIRDEFDAQEEVYHVERRPNGEFRIPGLTPVHEVEDALGVRVENEEISTFGGLITSEIGAIPEQGQQVLLQGPALEVRIDEVSEKRVIQTTVRLIRSEDEETAK